MLFDTDVLIWAQRGSRPAANLIQQAEQRLISVQTAMELFQGARDKNHLRLARRFLADFGFVALPLTADIGHRALVYVEAYALSHAMRAGDALIAATAVEHGLVLATANVKHFVAVEGLVLHHLAP